MFDDFDGDGHADIATTDTDLQAALLLFGDGTGGFPDFRLYPLANGPNGLESGDANGDHSPDLLAVNSASQGYPGVVSVLLNRCLSGNGEPDITSVRDVPNDQGGKVFVTWTASGLDEPGAHAITQYRVWRRIPAPALGARIAPGLAAFRSDRDQVVMRSTGTTVEYWEPLATVPAAFLEGYGYTAPTVQDSVVSHGHNNQGGSAYTAFFVQALTADPFVFYNSDPDSGYSVDNLAPPAPTPFVAVYGPSGTALHWGPSAAPDFSIFRLHRGTSADFVPAPDNLLTARPDTGYVDSPGMALFHYKLAAVDIHGNVGSYSAVVPPGSPTGVPGEIDDAIRIPNPVLAGDVTVSMRAAAGQPVRIELVDVSGRRIASVDAIGQGERMTLSLARADALAPGLYFVRFQRPALPSRSVAIVR